MRKNNIVRKSGTEEYRENRNRKHERDDRSHGIEPAKARAESTPGGGGRGVRKNVCALVTHYRSAAFGGLCVWSTRNRVEKTTFVLTPSQYLSYKKTGPSPAGCLIWIARSESSGSKFPIIRLLCVSLGAITISCANGPTPKDPSSLGDKSGFRCYESAHGRGAADGRPREVLWLGFP